MTPRISAIMPTADRRRFVPAAIWAFLAQNRDDSELVILDDGADPVADLVPSDPQIRYFRETPRQPLGAKRNRLCELARGEVIVHWDDDDWHAPDRLERQLAALEQSGADICGCDRLLFLADDDTGAWEYVYGGSKPWVAGGTLCYRRSAWQQRRFSTVGSGEDTLWVFAAPRDRIHVMADNSFYVARVHGGNTSRKSTRGTWWKPRDVHAVRALAAAGHLAPRLHEVDLRDLTVIIPHGGAERLPLLAHTLTSLRAALPRSPIVVVELGQQALAMAAAQSVGATHLFAEHAGEFQRARALNLGSMQARTGYLLWHDNDIVAEPGFYDRALAEAVAERYDYLIPFFRVQYLSDADTRAWLANSAAQPGSVAHALRSGPQASGGLGLVTRAFVERYGGLDERFRGWGGEDDAWWHKASLLGRAGFSRDSRQVVWHLFHDRCGGLAGAEARSRNPHYGANLALLDEIQRTKTRAAYLARYPTPQPLDRAQQISTAALHVPLFLYWEGPCPEWILRCRTTMLKHGGDIRLLGRDEFEALRTDDRDIDLDPLQPAHRADFIRSYLLAHHGGIWLDSDCLLMRPLDAVYEGLAARGFVAHRDRQGYYSNGFIAAAPGNPIAEMFYRAVVERLRSGKPLDWISIGGEPLTRLLRGRCGAFSEMPCAAIQPICWSQADRFFRTGSDTEHEPHFEPSALTYMLSKTQIDAYCRSHPRADLLAGNSFFSFILRKSLETPDPAPMPALEEAGCGVTPSQVFAGFHSAALRRRDESLSGPGSSLDRTATLREALPALLDELEVKTMLDAGCGDHWWLRETPLPVDRYIGVDIVQELVAANSALCIDGRLFMLADFTNDKLPPVDLVLTRDTLVHYDFATAVRALQNLRRTGARFLLATTFPDRHANRDVALGGWRPLNLALEPFNFPAPLRLLIEGCTENGGAYRDKALGLWRFEDLPTQAAYQ
jgi:GT2 family glycosyltransferase